MPVIGVALDKFQKGAERLDDPELQSLICVPLDHALNQHWQADAHFMIYQLVAGEELNPGGWPRLNKSVLNDVRLAGADVKVPVLVLDYDNPRHEEWTQERVLDFDVLLTKAADNGLELASCWTFFYFTQHGARLVYVLDSWIAAEEAEATIAGMVRDFLAHGIAVDNACGDWTRLYRLPQVIRDGRPTWIEGYFGMYQQPDKRLDARTITPGKAKLAQSYADLRISQDPLPDLDWCRQVMEETNPDTGRVRPSYFFKEAKKQLRHTACYPCVFEHAPLAPSGERNDAIQRLVGEAVTAVFNRIHAFDKEHLFALFLPALQQLNSDDPSDLEDFIRTGWSAVRRYWSMEAAKTRASQEENQQQQVEYHQLQTSLLSRILAGVSEWASVPEQEPQWWLQERLIAATANQFHVMTSAGYYDPVPVGRQLLVARIRELGMHALIGLTKEEDGKIKQVPAQEIIDRHATAVSSIEANVGAKGTHLRVVDKHNQTLVHGMFHRKNLEPKYDAEVDQWLRLLGGEDFRRLENWIGHALDFEGGPICALSIAGTPGCGKKMLYQGLAECIDTEVIASSKEFGRFAGTLLRTPFLVINEGLYKQQVGQDTADIFRAMVSGDPMMIEQKYREPILVRNPVRILFAANNIDVVQSLTGGRDLSHADREALALRLMHINVESTASDWLRQRGGLSFTRGWIHSDDGTRGQYRVARHFLYLYANRTPPPRGNRLLVEGNIEEAMMRQMSTRSGNAPRVVEALIRMVEAEGGMYMEGFVIDGCKIHTTTSAVVDYVNTMDSAKKAEVNHRDVGKVLRSLIVENSPLYPREVETARGKKKAKWRDIDAGILLDEAIEHGYACHRLQLIAEGQRSVKLANDQMVSGAMAQMGSAL